jgi:hypothetical protein
MSLADDLKALVDLAERHIQSFVKERGSFSVFAIARQADGKDQYLQSSGEFEDFREEIAETLRVLIALAQAGQINSYVMCSHTSEGREHFAILDAESKASGRTLVFLPFKKKILGGWAFGERQFKKDGPRVFAS